MLRSVAPLLAVSVVSGPLIAQEQDSVTLTTIAGVYTEEQAERGRALFDNVCIECHEPSDFTKAQFVNGWLGETLAELFWYLRESMPEDSPGLLPDRDYVAAIAYILSLNRLPAGESPLPTDTDVLNQIRFAKPESPTRQKHERLRWWRHEENR